MNNNCAGCGSTVTVIEGPPGSPGRDGRDGQIYAFGAPFTVQCSGNVCQVGLDMKALCAALQVAGCTGGGSTGSTYTPSASMTMDGKPSGSTIATTCNKPGGSPNFVPMVARASGLPPNATIGLSLQISGADSYFERFPTTTGELVTDANGNWAMGVNPAKGLAVTHKDGVSGTVTQTWMLYWSEGGAEKSMTLGVFHFTVNCGATQPASYDPSITMTMSGQASGSTVATTCNANRTPPERKNEPPAFCSL